MNRQGFEDVEPRSTFAHWEVETECIEPKEREGAHFGLHRLPRELYTPSGFEGIGTNDSDQSVHAEL